MLYRKIVDVLESPDQQETLAHIEMDAWVRFACASISAYDGPVAACKMADRMLNEFRNRFEAEPEEEGVI